MMYGKIKRIGEERIVMRNRIEHAFVNGGKNRRGEKSKHCVTVI